VTGRSTRAALLVLAIAACGDPPETSGKVHEPRRPGVHEPDQDSFVELAPAPETTLEDSHRDPEIDRALGLIRSSKLRFLAPESADDPAGDEYTAEQFASMLESKRDWVGYDITRFDLWLDEIATCSFLDRVAYRVVLADGTSRELLPWLVEQLALAKD